jgi:hypothetical protein
VVTRERGLSHGVTALPSLLERLHADDPYIAIKGQRDALQGLAAEGNDIPKDRVAFVDAASRRRVVVRLVCNDPYIGVEASHVCGICKPVDDIEVVGRR